MNDIFVGLIMLILGYSGYVAAVARHEQKKRWREGKADYYGNPKNE